MTKFGNFDFELLLNFELWISFDFWILAFGFLNYDLLLLYLKIGSRGFPAQ